MDTNGGGYFTNRGRRAALNAALPLLASYFADAATWDLEVSQQLAVSDDEPDHLLDDFAAGARLRASLAAAERLLTILTAVVAQPTFRYTQVRAESIGTIRGRLDLAQYSRQQGRIDVPRRYPVRMVERENATPENIMTAYAAIWIRRDLAAVPRHILPRACPEERALQTLEQSLKRALGLPLLAGTTQRAHEVWRRGTLDSLIDQVSRRLEAGRIARPEPYQELVDWISRSRSGTAVAAAGDREWSFYDEQFDTKLFEIWCLFKIAQQITAKVGDPVRPARSLATRRTEPIYVWNTGAGKLKLHFQPSLASLGEEGVVWRYEDGSDLRGFPDIAVTAENVTGQTLALLDPKLRRRSGAPTEEIYKLLGYFGNLRRDGVPVGAILYYSPGGLTEYVLKSGRGGEMRAIGLDPEGTDAQFATAAELALRTAGLSGQTLELLRDTVGATDEERTEHATGVRQAIAVESMQRAAEALPPATLAPTRKQTAANLHAIWGVLSDHTRTMIVTAEYFANTAPDDADHSGPLLGLAASVERVLREMVFDPAAATSPGIIPDGQTLGSSLRTLDYALRGRHEPEASAIASYLRSCPGINHAALRQVLPAARAMNRDFRIPAAHAEVVSSRTWTRGRAAILDVTTGILPRLVAAFGLPQPRVERR